MGLKLLALAEGHGIRFGTDWSNSHLLVQLPDVIQIHGREAMWCNEVQDKVREQVIPCFTHSIARRRLWPACMAPDTNLLDWDQMKKSI